MKCKCTNIQPQVKVIHNGAEHTATIVHKCALQDKHSEEYCRCECGHGWRKFHNEQ